MQASRRIGVDEGDDDVPASLLIEGQDLEDMPNPPAPPHQIDDDRDSFPRDGPSSGISPNRLGARQDNNSFLPPPVISGARRLGGISGMATASSKDKAMWRWANVENLDNFLKEVYIYYLGNGICSILLSRALNLLYVFFKI
jgi:autophagy-related protein 9